MPSAVKAASARPEPGQRGQPRPVGGRVAHPRDLAAQHGVLVPQHQQLGVLAQISPHQHGGQAEETAYESVQDRQ